MNEDKTFGIAWGVAIVACLLTICLIDSLGPMVALQTCKVIGAIVFMTLAGCGLVFFVVAVLRVMVDIWRRIAA